MIIYHETKPLANNNVYLFYGKKTTTEGITASSQCGVYVRAFLIDH
jgi:hypothetical protein